MFQDVVIIFFDKVIIDRTANTNLRYHIIIKYKDDTMVSSHVGLSRCPLLWVTVSNKTVG